MNIIQLPLGEVHPYKNNPRKNDGAVDAVAESIKAVRLSRPAGDFRRP